MNGLARHLVLTLRLNFRSKQPLIYGYLVPVLFLIGFGAAFRSGRPPLLQEMGQILTITILGGACFGMPVAMVNERERGVWRRYRLLPASTGALVLSAVIARYVLVASSAALQIVLAWVIYRTPFPFFPAQFLVAFTVVCLVFLGMGLVIAMLAETVPAVQALGQAIFLPMILIGGVGVPLRALPEWAQRVAAFLPGRYAVEALQACFTEEGGGLSSARFALGGLLVIASAGCLAGGQLFRWDAGQKIALGKRGWAALAFFAWIAVGVAAIWKGQAVPSVSAPKEPWQQVSGAEMQGIDYQNLPSDQGVVVPLAADLDHLNPQGKERMQALASHLDSWKPATDRNVGQRVRNLLSVCAVADLAQDRNEAEIARVVFNYLEDHLGRPDLKMALAWIVLRPGDGAVQLSIPELGIEGDVADDEVRERCALYAKKLLQRLRERP